MRAIVRICGTDPTYHLTPVQAVLIREGKPTERLSLVASNEDPRRYAVLSSTDRVNADSKMKDAAEEESQRCEP